MMMSRRLRTKLLLGLLASSGLVYQGCPFLPTRKLPIPTNDARVHGASHAAVEVVGVQTM
jgi:hypothetical protein